MIDGFIASFLVVFGALLGMWLYATNMSLVYSIVVIIVAAGGGFLFSVFAEILRKEH